MKVLAILTATSIELAWLIFAVWMLSPNSLALCPIKTTWDIWCDFGTVTCHGSCYILKGDDALMDADELPLIGQHNGEKKKDEQRSTKHTHKTKDRVYRGSKKVQKDKNKTTSHSTG
jgi:hypothetical protein